jgi:hypothetical protein
MPVELPPQQEGVFIPRADIFGQHVRILFNKFARNFVTEMHVLRLTGSAASGFTRPDSPDRGFTAINWDPARDQALRQPVLADDCEAYAFLSRDVGNGYFVWHGILGGQGGVRSERFGGPQGTAVNALAAGAVTIARDCHAVVALARDDTSTSLQILVGQPGTDNLPRQSVSLNDLGDAATSILLPSWAQAPPMLAAAPRPGGSGWRVGWPTAAGLAIVDIAPGQRAGGKDCSSAQSPASGASGQDPLGACLLLGDQLLTGTDSTYLSGSLSFSRDGLYALMIQQQTFSGKLKVRVFNLDLAARQQVLDKLTAPELIREACRVAKLHNESNELSKLERAAWLGDANLSQPCDGVS